ncbi:MAG: hypothetical protein IT529_16745 [Burkholderiales bacterium]|nr:hypothetical protein [Burkholderiales bacterium]
MKLRQCVNAVVLAALAVASVLLAPGAASAQGAADQWKFSLMPYLWLPSLEGTLRYGPPAAGGASPNVSVDADTLIGSLDFAMMLSGEARKGRWSVLADAIYLDLSGDTSHVKSVDFNPGPGPVNVVNTSLNLGTQTDFKGTIFSLAGGYAAVEDSSATLDVIGGIRYIDLEATTTWQLTANVTGPAGTTPLTRFGSVTKSDRLWDAIVGVKGRVKLGGANWFAPYHLDVGGGDSKLTWQGMAGVGYAWKWGEVLLAYRYLYYEPGKNRVIEDIAFGGLGLGVNFRF